MTFMMDDMRDYPRFTPRRTPPALLHDHRLSDLAKNVAGTLLYDGAAPLPSDEKIGIALDELEVFGYVHRAGPWFVAG